MSQRESIVIVDGVRTAIGSYGGVFRDVDAHQLGATAIRSVLDRTGIAPEEVDEVVMGQVGQVGPDAYNARRCAIEAGIPPSATAMNVNRLCSSGLQAIVTAVQQVALGDADVVVAGGDESMSRQPALDFDSHAGWKLGHRRLVDGTLSLVTDPFGRYPMGMTAEKVAARFGISRNDQDEFALRSQHRAGRAIAEGRFLEEVVPVAVPGADSPVMNDEHPRPTVTMEQMSRLRPVFDVDGSVTAGNSSGINDGAGAVVVMRETEARARGLTPRLRLRSWAVTGIEPEIMGFAPAQAVPVALEKAGMRLDDVDLIELNEAFAAQAVAVIRSLNADIQVVNPDGGAIALGHPVGATGAILTVKLMHALERMDRTVGIVTMCIGGGQGMAAVFERP